MKPTLILMCGLPGAGKTTLAKQLEPALNAVRFSPDEWMHQLKIDLTNDTFRSHLEQVLWQHTQQLLSLGQTVILEYGFWLRSERDEKRLWSRSHNVGIQLRFLDAPIDELFARVQARHHRNPDTEPDISRDQLEEWHSRLEPPTATELELYDQPEPAMS